MLGSAAAEAGRAWLGWQQRCLASSKASTSSGGVVPTEIRLRKADKVSCPSPLLLAFPLPRMENPLPGLRIHKRATYSSLTPSSPSSPGPRPRKLERSTW